MNGIMNKTVLGFILAAFVLAAGACTSRESATQAPSSYAFGGSGAAGGQQKWSAGQSGQPGQPGQNMNNRGGQAMGGEPGDSMGRDNDGYPREVIVGSEQEKPARPLVAAFPVGMRQKVLQDMGTVFFDFDKSGLSASTRRELDSNISWMRAHPDVVVRLIGHADERGTSEYNLALGMRRSDKVREYLINRGVASSRLITVSFGEELPLRRGHDNSAWSKNRRVEFGLDAVTAQR